MAIVLSPAARLVYTFRDNNLKVSTVSLQFPSSLTPAQLEVLGNAFSTAFGNISNALLLKYEIVRRYEEDDVAANAPPPESEVERKLIIPFQTNITGHGYTMEVPSPVFTVEQNGTNIVPANNAALVALVDLVLNGTVGAENGATTIAGIQLDSVGTARVRHRNRQD